MNQREMLLNLIQGQPTSDYVPAAFFMHFGPDYAQGQAAIDRHLEFFRYTGMDFVKIQYEQVQPAGRRIYTPEDWAHMPFYREEFFEPTLEVVDGLVKAAKKEALVVMTLYSPFMWATQYDREADIAHHLLENPAAVAKGMEIMTENVLSLVRVCKRLGVDGFYASSQGGEAFRFADPSFFQKYIKPTDLAVWNEIRDCPFNILHICDYEGRYADLSPFLDYPGAVVNCSLELDGKTIKPGEISRLFGRPFMGGMERKGVIAGGYPQAIQQAVEDVLVEAPERFILAADCTVPAGTKWENLKAAIETAHKQDFRNRTRLLRS